MKTVIYLLLLTTLSSCVIGQTENRETDKILLSDYTRSFVSINYLNLALVNAKVFDGTGSPAKNLQTVLIRNGIIVETGNRDEIPIPNKYERIDLNGKTVIPGLIGMHNHMRIPRSAMLSTSPRAYLACGVTTIQTCGTGNPYEELAIAKSINKGEQPGTEIINSGPYFTGAEGKPNFIRFTDAKMVTDTIKYWAEQGVKWLKVYRNTRPEELKVIVDAAHKYDLKVTGHLCATSYIEAAEIGIDVIEHGFIHSYDFADDRTPNSCSGNTDFRSTLVIESEEVKRTQQILITENVALGSTLSIFEAQANAEADSRDIDLMAPVHKEAYLHRRKRKQELGKDWYFKDEWLRKSMAYDLQFYRAGGLLVAGPDPGLHNMPGYGDQKNYELLIEAGFKPKEAIQVMTSNGAVLLGRKDLGTIEQGKTANLVVLGGDLEADSKIIRAVDIIFKNGIGYNPDMLINSIKGNVGSDTDNYMTYFGQREPSNTPEIFAPELISKSNRHEFGCTFSKDGREFYFGVDNNGIMEIHFSKLTNGVWSNQVKLFDSDSISYNDPMLSPDEKRLYFISNSPIDKLNPIKDIDIWYIERESKSKQWSDPINLGEPINSELDEYYTSFTENGALYFSSRDKSEDAPRYAFDIYRSKYKYGQFLSPEKLSKNINTNRYEADVFIAPNESYMIFCSIRRNGIGEGDLYISFRDAEGNWSEAMNMGESINTAKHELCPFVSANGKYLFYTSDKDIYWVSTDILESYKKEKSR